MQFVRPHCARTAVPLVVGVLMRDTPPHDAEWRTTLWHYLSAAAEYGANGIATTGRPHAGS
ncbi:MAG: hypothetical protein NVS4B13_00390 [Candidatus Elarobacter sp.]